MILVSSFLSKECMAANFILQNYSTIIFHVGNGICGSLCAHVGNSVGNKNKKIIVKLIKSGYIIGVILGVSFCLFSYINRSYIISFYTTDSKVISNFEDVIFIFCVSCLFEQPQISASGINEGLGRQKYMTFLSFLFVYFIGIPSMIILTFYYKLYLRGIWYGMLINSILLLLAYSISIFIKDIDTTIKENENFHKASMLDCNKE